MYLDLMEVIRQRFEIIEKLKSITGDKYFIAETCGFHVRKILEGIGSACLVVLENGTGQIYEQTKHCYKPDQVFRLLKGKGKDIFPSPSIIRQATPSEAALHNISAVIEGQPEKRISIKELRDTYSRINHWNHEVNPYSGHTRESFYNQHVQYLWDTVDRLKSFIYKHFIAINGNGWFCTLKDDVDGKVKLVPLKKVEGLDSL
jgi:hypothetical protein